MSMLSGSPPPFSPPLAGLAVFPDWASMVKKGDIVTVKSAYASSRPFTARLHLHSKVQAVRARNDHMALPPVVELLLEDVSGGLGWHSAEEFHPGRHADKPAETSQTSPEAQDPRFAIAAVLRYTGMAEGGLANLLASLTASEQATVRRALNLILDAQSLLTEVAHARRVGTPRACEGIVSPLKR